MLKRSTALLPLLVLAAASPVLSQAPQSRTVGTIVVAHGGDSVWNAGVLDAARAAGKDVIVVPVLVSKGSISRDKIPSDLAGLPIVYSGEPLLPHTEISRWIESRLRGSTR